MPLARNVERTFFAFVLFVSLLTGSAVAQTTVKISFWGEVEQVKLWNNVLVRFQQKHPDIHLDAIPGPWAGYHDKLSLQLVCGTIRDVIVVSPASSDRWLSPLYQRMGDQPLQQDIMHADETTLQVLHEPGRAAQTQSYLWLYRTGREGPPIVFFEYLNDGSQACDNLQKPSVTLREVAAYLNVIPKTAYRLLRHGTLKGIRIRA